MYTEHVIAKVQRVKVIGVCSAVNMFVKLVGTLYSCKFQRSLRCRGGCYGMTQVLFNITLLNFISNISTSANNRGQSYAKWIAVVIIFEITIITPCAVFAFLNRKVTLKEFQTQSILLLAYLLALTSVVGVAIYFITASIGGDQSGSLPFGIVCLVLSVTVYLCIFMLFLPPVLPALKKFRTFFLNCHLYNILRYGVSIYMCIDVRLASSRIDGNYKTRAY